MNEFDREGMMCWICDLYGDPEIEDGRWFLNPDQPLPPHVQNKTPGPEGHAAYGSDPES